MSRLIFFDAFKFGFVSLFKNIESAIISALISVGLFFGGLALIVAIALIPVLAVLNKIIYALNNTYAMFVNTTLSLEEKVFATIFYALKFIYNNYGSSILLLALGLFLFLLLMLCLIIFIAFGWIRVATKFARGHQTSFRDFFSSPGLIVKGVGLSIISIILIGLPWIATVFVFNKSVFAGSFCIIFSVAYTLYLPFKMAFASWFIVDRNISILEAIKSSFCLKFGLVNILLLMLISLPILVFSKMFMFLLSTIMTFKILVLILSIFLQFIYSTAMIISIGYLYTNLHQDRL